jgi:hypothetical protein
VEEIRETEIEQETASAEPMASEEEVMEGKPICPKCSITETRWKGDGDPAICRECKATASRARLTAEAAAKDNNPDRSNKNGQFDKKTDSPGNPTAAQTLSIMQARIDHHLSEVRRIHMAMLVVREIAGVEFEIRMPSVTLG